MWSISRFGVGGLIVAALAHPAPGECFMRASDWLATLAAFPELEPWQVADVWGCHDRIMGAWIAWLAIQGIPRTPVLDRPPTYTPIRDSSDPVPF